MKMSLFYKLTMIFLLVNILGGLNSPFVALGTQQEKITTILETQQSDEYLVAYAEKTNVESSDIFQILLGVYSPGQGFLGNKIIKYYNIDTPQIENEISTIEGQFSVISLELVNQPGYHTYKFIYNSQITLVDVIARDTLPEGTDQLDFVADFENSYPSLGSDNRAQISLFAPVTSFMQFDGSEIVSITSNAFINGINYDFVLGLTKIPSGFYFDTLDLEIPFSTPIWWEINANISLFVSFSGSNLYTSYTKQFSLPTRLSGQNIQLMLPQGIVGGDRSSFGEEDNTIDLSIQLSGDNPNGSFIDLYFEMPGYSKTYFLSDLEVTDFITEISISIPYDHPLGDGYLTVELKNDGNVIDSSSIPFIIYDELAVSLNFSTEILIPDQLIEILVYTYREDSYYPEASFVSIYQDSSLQSPIFEFETDQYGRKILNYTIPSSNSGKQLDWWIKIEPLEGSSYRGQLIEWSFNIVGETQLDLNSDLFIVDRGDLIILSAQVMANTQIVSEGTLTLISENTNTIIAEYDLSQNSKPNIDFLIDFDFPKGISFLRWDYSGTDHYSPVDKIISLYVYSHPIFQDITLNHRYALSGDSVKVHGFLYQEDFQNNQLQDSTSVQLWEVNSTGEFLVDFIQVSETGEFIYEYQVPENVHPGIYTFQLRFLGDESQFYRSSQNQPIIELEIRAELGLSWTLPDDSDYILGGTTYNAAIFGRQGYIYEISYIADNNIDDWTFLDQINLSEENQSEIELQFPNIYGPVTLRLLELETNKSQFYDLILYKNPHIEIELPKDAMITFNPVIINIDSSEPYTFLIDGINPQEENVIGEGNVQWNHIFSKSGEHVIHINLIGEYLTKYVFEYSFTVYESVKVQINELASSPIIEGTFQTLNVKLTDYLDNPLPNVHVQLVSCITCSNVFTNIEQILTEGYSSIQGTLIFQSQIIGHSLALSIQEDSNRFIQPMIFELDIPIEQIIELQIDLDDLVIVENTPSDLNIRIKYQYSNYSPNNVQLRFRLMNKENSNLIQEMKFITDQNGQAIIQLGNRLDSGNYLIEISSDDPRYQSFTETRYLTIIPQKSIVDLLLTNIWILPALGTGALGSGAILMKIKDMKNQKGGID